MGEGAYRRQGEEGDAQQSEAGGQQASLPGTGGLVPISDGGKGDLEVCNETYINTHTHTHACAHTMHACMHAHAQTPRTH